MNLADIAMRLFGPASQSVETELEVMTRLLPLKGARVLELGCGAAEKTRQIAERTDVSQIVATEVDQIQHQRNVKIDDLPKVVFKSCGAEAIAEPDAGFDIVVMFKSLHHVPLESLDDALKEVCRVLKPGGLAYLSEPVFAGEFNEVLRLFHDESRVRHEAFAAVERAVTGGVLELEQEYFFKNVIRLESFDQFERGVIDVTHTRHTLTPELLEQVRSRFESYRGEDGSYVFEIPNRVDLLRRPAAAR